MVATNLSLSEFNGLKRHGFSNALNAKQTYGSVIEPKAERKVDESAEQTKVAIVAFGTVNPFFGTVEREM